MRALMLLLLSFTETKYKHLNVCYEFLLNRPVQDLSKLIFDADTLEVAQHPG